MSPGARKGSRASADCDALMAMLADQYAASGMAQHDIVAKLEKTLAREKSLSGKYWNADDDSLRRNIQLLAASAIERFGDAHARGNSKTVPPATATPNTNTGTTEKEPWTTEPANFLGEFIPAPISTDDVPEEIGNFAGLYAARTGIDSTPLAVMMVGACAAAITDEIQICADSNTRWFQQPRLWTLVIAPPGEGKTPAFKEALKPLRDLHHELTEQWKKDCKEFAAHNDGKDKGEQEPLPRRPRVTIDDATLEALSEVLVDNPRGVLEVTDEFSTWLGSLDRYTSKGGMDRDRGQWLRLFDGGPNHIERISRGSVYVPNWGASIITCTTPAQLQKLAKHLPEDGLAQRFMTFIARDRKDGNDNITGVEAARGKYTDTVRRLYALHRRAQNGVVPLSPDARERLRVWNTDNTKLMRASRDTSTALAAHFAKHPTLALRVALTFHCIHIARLNKSARDPAAFPVSVETLDMALRYMHRVQQHAIALHLSLFGFEVYALVQDIARFILTRLTGGLQRRDLLRQVHTFKSAEGPHQDAALSLLMDGGWLREDTTTGYNKSHPTRFEVNPHLAGCFARIAARVREHRAAMLDAITEAAGEHRDEKR